MSYIKTKPVWAAAPSGAFFFSLARIEDSLSANGGISSKTVAYVMLGGIKFELTKKKWHLYEKK